MWVPDIGDEVLVAFADNDTSSAFILGGLWSALNLPPLVLPNDTLSKRTIKTGLTETLGHTLEFDDALQSITITTSTDQKISMDPLSIELTNLAGTVSIKLDNTEQSITLTAANKIELDALQISMTATKIEMDATEVSITSAGPCSVTGLPIKLN
jgi:phage baseplate assembly protein gpV